MAQLRDDCFAFGGRLVPLDEALSQAALQFRRENAPGDSVALYDALDRLAAHKVESTEAVPPHPNSAVDGYAVRFADLNPDGVTALPTDGYAAAGDSPQPLPPGHARRILTGAVLPPGADTVFMDEDVVLSETKPRGAVVELPQGLRIGANAREAGEDIAVGDILLQPGQRIGPADLGRLASAGLKSVTVLPRLRVALFSTGNEVRDPGQPLEPGQVFDSNRQTLRGLLERAGARVADLGILPDDPDRLERALSAAHDSADLILTSGGVSAGDHDIVRQVLERRGKILFWRLAVKPGRPLALGRFGDTPVIGLPGNPAAAVMMFHVAALPLIRVLEGGSLPRPIAVPVVLDFAHRKKPERIEYVRVRVAPDAQGQLRADKFPREGAGILSSIAWATGYVALEPDRLGVQPGEIGQYTAFDWTFSAAGSDHESEVPDDS